MSNTPEQDAKVFQRALTIVHDHELRPIERIITISGHNEWKVKSSVDGFPYTVTFEFGIYSCTCNYSQFKGQCKHIKAVKIVKERDIYCPMNGEEEEEII